MECKTTNRKLGTKVNIYLEWGIKSQQFTNLKERKKKKNLTDTNNITKIQIK